MRSAITRVPARSIANCELTYLQREPIDHSAAVIQHRGYCAALAAAGIQVLTLPAIEELPDSVFVEDSAIILDELAVITPMGVASRRPEPALIEPAIAARRTHVERITLPATIEGGDVMRLRRTIYVSPSTRTNAAGIEALQSLTQPWGYRVVVAALRNCLHLKTACTALDDDTILINRTWVDESAFDGRKLVDVPPNEPSAANVVRAGASILIGAQYPRTIDLIANLGCAVLPVDASEFCNAEAALTCLSLIFEM